MKRRLPIAVDVKLGGASDGGFSEVESLAEQIKRKDREHLLVLMRQRDESKKTWLSNFLNGELHSMLASDKHNLESHITSQSSDFDKLAKLVSKLSGEHATLAQRFAQSEEDLRMMEEDMQFAKDSELRETEEELARLEREEGEIRKEIMAKRDQARRQEAVIGQLMEQLALRENEVDRIQNILDDKDRELTQMEDRMKANGSAANANSNYSAYKGDAVDE